MRTFMFSVAVAAAALAAVPAAAQYQNRGHYDRNHNVRGGWDHRGPDHRAVAQLRRELDQVEIRIERSARRGIISPREALGLRREANQVRNRFRRAGRNGLTGREFAALRQQVNWLEQRVRSERRDRDGRRG